MMMMIIIIIIIISRTSDEGPEGEWRCSSTLSLTSVLDRGGWSHRQAPAASPPEMTRYRRVRGWMGPMAGLDG